MRCTVRFLISVCLVLLLGGLNGLAADTAASCLERGKQLFAAKEYAQAKTQFIACLKQDPSNVEALLSLAGVELTLDELDNAEQHFQAALQKMDRTSAYRSYTYSMLGDIALKKKKNDEALGYYSKSLESNAANVNSLIGKGVITEYNGDKQQAAEFYRSALAVEPLNLIARQRLINLEPEYFTDAEILNALKQRYAVSPDTKTLTDADRELFLDIHSTEQRQGAAYLRNKYVKVPAEYMVTLNKGTEFERDILTLEGYQALQKSVGQDAITVFQQVGVPIQSVFALRNLKGEKIFKEDSTLTKSGFYVYTEALKNHKVFLLPDEAVPPSAARLEQVSRRVEDLKQQGLVQISGSEKKMLERETNCSDETLRQDLGCTK